MNSSRSLKHGAQPPPTCLITNVSLNSTDVVKETKNLPEGIPLIKRYQPRSFAYHSVLTADTVNMLLGHLEHIELSHSNEPLNSSYSKEELNILSLTLTANNLEKVKINERVNRIPIGSRNLVSD